MASTDSPRLHEDLDPAEPFGVQDARTVRSDRVAAGSHDRVTAPIEMSCEQSRAELRTCDE